MSCRRFNEIGYMNNSQVGRINECKGRIVIPAGLNQKMRVVHFTIFEVNIRTVPSGLGRVKLQIRAW